MGTIRDLMLAKVVGGSGGTTGVTDVQVNGTSVVTDGVANIDTDDLGIAQTVTDWLDQHVDPDTEYVIDDTLSISGAAADAKVVGDELADVKSAVNDISDDVAGLITDKADVIVDTASGAIASIPDGMAAPAKDITISIEPIQSGSGDPSPTNVRPISGWTGANVTRTGKNLYNTQTANDGKVLAADGSLAINAQRTTSDFIKVRAGSIYVQNALAATVGRTCATYDKYRTFIRIASFSSTTATSGAITINSGEEFVRVSSNLSDKDAIMVELGSTATAYEPYTGTTIPITFPSEAGTVYGGTLDVTTGLLTVTMAEVDLGTLNWNKLDIYFYATIVSKKIGSNKMLCECFYNVPNATSRDNITADNQLTPFNNSSSAIAIRCDTYSTKEDFKTAVSGVMLVYELATPRTYQLSPTEVQLLLGENNVWADTGDSTVTYRADTKLYIQSVGVEAETLAPGSEATVEKSVEDGVLTLTFGIPRGDTGATGATGATPDFSIGTVSTLPAGSSATASITGTAETPVLNLGIPQGPKGDPGEVTQAEFDELKSAFIGANEFNGINNHIFAGALIQLATSKWVANADYKVLLANVSPGDRIGIIAGPTNATYYAFLTDDNVVIGETAPFAGDYTVPATLNASANVAITAPNNAKYLYITLGTPSTDRTPANLTNNGLDILATIPANIDAIETKTVNYVASLHSGARFAYNATGVNKYLPFVIEAGHTYKMVSTGVNVNVRYMDEMGGNSYGLATNVGGQNPIKYATAEHDGAVIYFGSNGGAIDITIIDVTYENINIIVDPNGNGDFKTLRDGVAYAITRPHSKVYVNPGTYDLLTEFASEITAAGNTQYGICLENDVHIVFSSGAVVTALYTGNVQNVTTYFAPFYVGTNGGGFTLENLTIKASNTRYCVHDEYNGANVRTNNKYINCRFEFDNTTAPIDYYPQCIGGGVAKHSYVEIVGCYFKSKRAESQKTPLVSYHNASDAYVDDALSYINIRDCYFADTYGMFRFSYNGSYSEPASVAYLQGNSFGMAPEVSATGSATVVNVSILEWGNIVRT